MKYDVTGRSQKEINAEVIHLAEAYETVEVVQEEGRVMIICSGKTKSPFTFDECNGCRRPRQVRRMDSGYQFCHDCWDKVVVNKLTKAVEVKDTMPRMGGVAG